MATIPIIERVRGERIVTDAARSFLLDDPERIHMVERGHLDVFAVELNGDEPVSRRRHVARVPAASMAFGCDRVTDSNGSGRVFGFLAVPSRDAVLIAGERSGVAADAFDIAATSWIDDWIERLSEFPVRGRPVPPDAALLEAAPAVDHPAGAVLSAQHRDVVWVSANAPLRWLGRDDTVVHEGEPLLPVTERTWFELDVDAAVTTVYTPTAFLRGRLWPALLRFGGRVLEYAMLAEAENEIALQSRRRRVFGARRASVTRALGGLGAVLDGTSRGTRTGLEGRTPLQAAVQLVARSCGASAEIRESPTERDTPPAAPEAAAERVARRAGTRTRRIELVPGWWKRDGPSFVGFTEPDGRPIGVVSRRRGGYRAVDPESGTAWVVDRGRAARIASVGVALYPPLPDDAGRAGTTLRFALHRCGQDLRTVAAVAVLGGIAALLAPILIGQVLAELIPRARVTAWNMALIALTLLAFGNAFFYVVRELARLRIEGRIDERLQAAVWDRLIALPAPFFRRFTTGDLADRARGAGQLGRMLAAAALQAATSGVFSMFSLALLFYYHWLLALYVSGMLLVLAIATGVFACGQARHYRDVCRMQGAMDGFVLQMINGVSKLRVANAESHALAHWARRFTEQKRAALRARRWAAGRHAVAGLFQPLALAAICGVVYDAGPVGAARPGMGMGLAAFLSFNAAFGQLTAAVHGLTNAVTDAIGLIPLLERVKPVLDEPPKPAGTGTDPGDLQGEVEFSNATFRYAAGAPNAIEDLSFRIRPGEYVAFVGPSGCGKSTIYRLLLGFEQPTSGSVLLDGHDLSGLDMAAVRPRMGVVLQDCRLAAGSIYENIAGMWPLSAEDAWAAARAAALDDDIRAMPMEMRTVVPADGAGFSVGQKQRLLVARALARRPRILLFDEATSALDNRAQAVVQAALKRMNATRVVIAHRLSSLRDVDRIYVLDRGRLVESGTYDNLMARAGLFAALARRQLVQE